MSGDFEGGCEAELFDLAGCVPSLCAADLGAMSTPAGVAPGTALGSMFMWDEGRLLKASKWREEPQSEKHLVAKVARAILSLRDCREATRMMELGAQAGVFPTSPASRIMVVEPVAATKKGSRGSAS